MREPDGNGTEPADRLSPQEDDYPRHSGRTPESPTDFFRFSFSNVRLGNCSRL